MEHSHIPHTHRRKSGGFHRLGVWIASLVLFILSVFFLIYPFIPKLTYYVIPEVKSAPPESAYGPSALVGPMPNASKITNYGIVSTAKVSGEIFEGVDSSVLDKGMWHIPKSSTPDKGGNTIITGHRFTYAHGAGVFYHLDKVQKDDVIDIYWEGKKYSYKVFEIKTVPPTALEVEKNTEEPILTLYTCTPIMTATDRLVVKAKLQE